jgi:solute carrier family 35, member F1/2
MVSSSLKYASTDDRGKDNPPKHCDDDDMEVVCTNSNDPSLRGGVVERAMHHLRCHWKILVLGQVMSLLLASGGATQATLHLDCGLSAPTFTMATAYLIQALLQWVLLLRRRAKERQEQREHAYATHEVLLIDQPQYNFFQIQLHRPTWQYVVMGFLDAQANSLTMLAFRYTTLTSVTLLDALAIPSAMLISRAFLNRRYTCLHFVGLIFCIFGVIFNVLQDVEADLALQQNANGTKSAEELEYPNKLWGDILAASGGILYGLNDVLAEATVRSQNSIVEYLAMVGLFGFLFSFVQSLIFERDNILEFFGRNADAASTCSIAKGWGLYVTFVAITVTGYIGGSRFLMLSEAAFFNLSLLTGDLWCVAFSVLAENIVPRPQFFLALTLVLGGVILYEMAPHPVVNDLQITQTAAQQLADIDNDFELQGMDEDADGDFDGDYGDDDVELL